MKTAFRLFGVIIGILVIFSMSILPDSSPKAMANLPPEPPVIDDPNEEPISSKSAPSWVWASKPWTEEEMAAAKPYPLPENAMDSRMVSPVGPSPEVSTHPGLVTFPGSLPEGEGGALSPTAGNDLFSMPDPTASQGYGYPAPYTRYTQYGKYKSVFPNKAIGVLYFVQNGQPYRCSAAAIGPYAIWTAGHCVHDGSGSDQGWSYYVMFVPAYDGKKIPSSNKWDSPPGHLWSLNGWIYDRNLAYDMGGAILERHGSKGIGQKTGWLGFAYRPDSWGYLAERHWFAIGYPAVYPYDGTKQAICAASHAYSNTTLTPAPMAIGCDQTGGTSGGPWILGYGTYYLLNGNMSHRRNGYDQEVFSPYFGDGANNLFLALVNDYP